LTDFFGARKVGLAGGFLSSVSLFASAFITDIKFYFLTYGLGFGLGQALLLSATLSILPHYFNKRLSLANGLMTFIGTIVIVILPVCTAPILEKFGLKEAFYFLSAVNSITILMALTYKSTLPNNRKENFMDRIKKSFGLEILKSKDFLVWCVGSIIGQFAYLTPIIIIVCAFF
jgi:MFS family permease